MKPSVTREFELPGGGKSLRASMDDLQTIHQRAFGRVRDVMADEAANKTVIPGVNAYNYGQYDEALEHFREAIKIAPDVQRELYPYLIICQRVLDVEKDSEDRRYEERLSRWESSLFRRFRPQPQKKIRCKYCGHYTRYIDPDEGFAYLGTNNCDRCGRGYATPDFIWDSLDGQAYIYYRGSAPGKEFYREFEEVFDVEEPLER